ncbi:MAG: hypothetical protein U0M06_05540 [Clostridia bacterium]|nr:hypothetical protein [Clostridia bacterium]
MFIHSLLTGLKFTAIMGILAHVFGLVFPKEFLRYDSFLFSSYDWEKDGRYYNKFGVSHWMSKLPDMSRAVPYMFRKKLSHDLSSDHIKRYIDETCMAELVHILLILSSPILTVLVDGITGVVFMMIYAFCNIPFVIIQRYNRPKLVRLLRRQLYREKIVEEAENESAGTVL